MHVEKHTARLNERHRRAEEEEYTGSFAKSADESTLTGQLRTDILYRRRRPLLPTGHMERGTLIMQRLVKNRSSKEGQHCKVDNPERKECRIPGRAKPSLRAVNRSYERAGQPEKKHSPMQDEEQQARSQTHKPEDDVREKLHENASKKDIGICQETSSRNSEHSKEEAKQHKA